MVIRAFIISQFINCPVLWIYHSRIMKIKVSKLHEQTLKFIKITESHKKIPERNKVRQHPLQNLQVLVTEISKVQSS